MHYFWIFDFLNSFSTPVNTAWKVSVFGVILILVILSNKNSSCMKIGTLRQETFAAF